ncbi:hypothetical protein [Streptomyces clavuligerus]|uniref:Secreted protein n=1 Tax=Streptomyces clavuligerus TaxID=1901 RepID=B5GUD9_STRCL|nr:hypothetical protein [Streptomyces clavuligerus]EDY49935.1 hypothetical protein SSCG_03189 [Streptomyces clavuligerus]EFG03652.1 Hypothetical protein SCLAV_p0161 [Streptomyces clavuligerus]MBY6307787.1 hypothetical protein [Streptomyces clavuligerus]QCS09663.1 hypothetical protein CRV15_28910 [Streptomyces clavuligerus]QPJ98293.1 hypothetical protein GE265_35450 [Streptomyces clavuligerus]
MRTVARTLRNITAVFAFAGAAVSLAVQPAAAHSGYFYKSRNGCVYTGGLSAIHNYAWTVKDSGGCAGHAWLQVRYSNGVWSDPIHAAGRVSISTGTNGIAEAWHKTQSDENWVRSHP